MLYEIEEKGWGYGPVYESGIINISEAKKRIRGGKLHLDVPKEAMGKIIGREEGMLQSTIHHVESLMEELRDKVVKALQE